MPFSPAASARILESHPDAHWVLDDTGRLTHANRAALRLMGQPAAAVIGTNIAHLVADPPEHCRALLQQGRRSSVATPARLRLRTPEGTDLVCRCDIALLSPAEADAPAQLWCRLVPQSLGNSHFKALNQQIDTLRREVVRRQEAESEMRQQREWLQTVLTGITEAVVATDLQGRIVLMNPVAATLSAWPAGEALHQPVSHVLRLSRIIGTADAVDLAAAALRDADSPQAIAEQMRLIAKDGSEHQVQASASALHDEDGQLCGAVLVLRSIDDEVQAELQRRALEHQLRQAQKMEAIGTLAGGIAHDFNNVIGSVITNAALARMELPADHAAQQALLQIHRAGDRARALVRQILAFSRRDPQSLQRHTLQPLLDEAVGLLRGTLPARVHLQVNSAAEPVRALVDGMQFQQVVMNLCTNAWHALPADGGEITVTLDRLPAQGETPVMARLRVIDNGCGMDAATCERIFEPFFTTKPVGAGTGLGLAVVHGIVTEHKGRLAVDSAPGIGSTFTVLLPALQDDGPSITEPAVPAGEVTNGAGPAPAQERIHVAYVDDDELMRSTVERLLKRRGYEVSSHAGAAQALRALSLPATLCDVLVTDFNMPHTSGLDLAREVRQRFPHLPVVITSGNISEELRQGAQVLGGIRLLNKEDSFERLSGLIAEVVRRG